MNLGTLRLFSLVLIFCATLFASHKHYDFDLIKQGVDESAYKDRFYSWLSEPRFHYFPLTFAFLMNIVFNDFNNININRIKNDPFWLGILHQNEMDLSKIYFKSCYNFLTSPNCQSTNLFFNNFYYGA